MKYYPFPKKPVLQAGFAVFLLGLLMLSRDSMYGLTVFGFLPSQIAMAAMAGILGLSLLILHRRALPQLVKDPRLAAWGIMALLFLIPMVLKRDWQLMYVSIPFYLAIAVLVSFFTDSRTAARYYLVILSCLGLYSVLATYGLRMLADRGILPVPMFQNNSGFPFYQFGLTVVSQSFVAMRNFGIFREPGVYQFFLLLGLFLNNYTARWEKPWVLWTVNGILALTMLTTFATGGIIELGLLVIFLFWDKKWYKNRKLRIFCYCCIAAIGAAVIWILVTKNVFYQELTGVFGKFFWDTPPEESRLYAIRQDLRCFLHHPILGARLRDVLYSTGNNTTSTMIQYGAFGFLTGSLHVLAWGLLCWDRKRNLFGNLFLLLILFMSFNTQNLIGNPMFWMFPVLALLEKGIPFVQEKLRNRRDRK